MEKEIEVRMSKQPEIQPFEEWKLEQNKKKEDSITNEN
jgi:hypothetical protein